MDETHAVTLQLQRASEHKIELAQLIEMKNTVENLFVLPSKKQTNEALVLNSSAGNCATGPEKRLIETQRDEFVNSVRCC